MTAVLPQGGILHAITLLANYLEVPTQILAPVVLLGRDILAYVLSSFMNWVIPFFTWGNTTSLFLRGATPREKSERCGVRTHTLRLTSEGFPGGALLPLHHRALDYIL